MSDDPLITSQPWFKVAVLHIEHGVELLKQNGFEGSQIHVQGASLLLGKPRFLIGTAVETNGGAALVMAKIAYAAGRIAAELRAAGMHPGAPDQRPFGTIPPDEWADACGYKHEPLMRTAFVTGWLDWHAETEMRRG
jgi:hypothetical protein